MVTVRGSAQLVETRLRSGQLACGCGGVLRPWGRARPRRIATFTGAVVVRPLRSMCAGCEHTHVLLPSGLLSRRRYAAAVIFAGVALRVRGLKVSAVAARLRLAVPEQPGRWFSVPTSTVGRWLSRFAGRAEALRQAWAGVLAWVDAQARPVAAAGPVVADALAVLQAVTAGLRTRFAGLATVAAHEVAAHLTGGMLLAPVLPPVAGNTNWFLVAAAKGS